VVTAGRILRCLNRYSPSNGWQALPGEAAATGHAIRLHELIGLATGLFPMWWRYMVRLLLSDLSVHRTGHTKSFLPILYFMAISSVDNSPSDYHRNHGQNAR
jgi:hypothetical protein